MGVSTACVGVMFNSAVLGRQRAATAAINAGHDTHRGTTLPRVWKRRLVFAFKTSLSILRVHYEERATISTGPAFPPSHATAHPFPAQTKSKKKGDKKKKKAKKK